MAKKPDIDNLSSGFRSSNKLNTNFDGIAEAFENTLSRDGSGPNEMLAPLDMNSQRIINLPEPVEPTDAVRLVDVGNAVVDHALLVEAIEAAQEASDIALEAATAAEEAIESINDRALTDFSNASYALDDVITAPTVARPPSLRGLDTRNVADYAGSDFTTKLLNAQKSLLESGGGKMGLPTSDGALVLEAPFRVPDDAHIFGLYANPGEGASTGGPFKTKGLNSPGVIQQDLSSGAQIQMGHRSHLSNVVLRRYGMPEEFASATEAIDDIAGWQGRPLVGGGVDIKLSDLMILGFEYAYEHVAGERLNMRDVRFDCQNGIRFAEIYDVDLIQNVRGWPYMTAHRSWTEDNFETLARPGTAFEFYEGCDWTNARDMFAIGYQIGCDLVANTRPGDPHPRRPAHVSLPNMSLDNIFQLARTDTIGIRIGENVRSTVLEAPRIAAHGIGIQHNGDGVVIVQNPRMWGTFNAFVEQNGGDLEIYAGNLEPQDDYPEANVIRLGDDINSTHIELRGVNRPKLDVSANTLATKKISYDVGDQSYRKTARPQVGNETVLEVRGGVDGGGSVFPQVKGGLAEAYRAGIVEEMEVLSTTRAVEFTASVSGSAMLVSAVTGGKLFAGQVISGTGQFMIIVEDLTGNGGPGFYKVSPPQNVSSRPLIGENTDANRFIRYMGMFAHRESAPLLVSEQHTPLIIAARSDRQYRFDGTGKYIFSDVQAAQLQASIASGNMFGTIFGAHSAVFVPPDGDGQARAFEFEVHNYSSTPRSWRNEKVKQGIQIVSVGKEAKYGAHFVSRDGGILYEMIKTETEFVAGATAPALYPETPLNPAYVPGSNLRTAYDERDIDYGGSLMMVKSRYGDGKDKARFRLTHYEGEVLQAIGHADVRLSPGLVRHINKDAVDAYDLWEMKPSGGQGWVGTNFVVPGVFGRMIGVDRASREVRISKEEGLLDANTVFGIGDDYAHFFGGSAATARFRLRTTSTSAFLKVASPNSASTGETFHSVVRAGERAYSWGLDHASGEFRLSAREGLAGDIILTGGLDRIGLFGPSVTTGGSKHLYIPFGTTPTGVTGGGTINFTSDGRMAVWIAGIGLRYVTLTTT